MIIIEEVTPEGVDRLFKAVSKIYVCDTNESCPAGRLPHYRSQQDVRLSYKRILLTIEGQSWAIEKSSEVGFFFNLRL